MRWFGDDDKEYLELAVVLSGSSICVDEIGIVETMKHKPREEDSLRHKANKSI
jgi:hypothetical protein